MLKRILSVTLAGLLVLNSPASIIAHAAAAGEAGGLSLTSDPQGAGVFVDGSYAGETPLSVSVPAGDHRVRLVKAGYLENARIVSVRAGEPTNLQVRLTRNAGETARPEQVQVAVGQAPAGGGRSMLPFLLLGLGGGFAGGYLFQKSRTSETTTPANRLPTVGGASASPSIGLMSSTVFSFSAAGPADPDGDALTYTWTFGDGTTSTLANPTKVYDAAGPFTVTVTIGDGKGGTATASTPVTVESLAGTWTGSLVGNQTYTTTLVLVQSAATIVSATSTYADTQSNSGVVGGNVALSNQTATPIVTLIVTVGTNAPFTFTTTQPPTLGATDTLVGVANGSGFTNAAWSLTR